MIFNLKRSNAVIVALLFGLVGLFISQAFYIADHVKPKIQECTPELELGKGKFLEEVCLLDYSHLHVSIPDVELLNEKTDFIKIEGYETAQWVQNVEVRNDTLFISKKDKCMPRYVDDESINAMRYYVGAKDLNSITITKGGSIKHHLRPYAAHADGEPVYKPQEVAYHTYEFDSLQLNLGESGYIDAFMEGNYLEVNRLPVRSNYNMQNWTGGVGTSPISGAGYSVLFGEVNEIKINPGYGSFYIRAEHLKVLKAIVNAEKNKHKIGGSFRLNVSDHLEAYLYNDIDVLYRGNPTIIKEETSYGRVINANKMKF